MSFLYRIRVVFLFFSGGAAISGGGRCLDFGRLAVHTGAAYSSLSLIYGDIAHAFYFSEGALENLIHFLFLQINTFVEEFGGAIEIDVVIFFFLRELFLGILPRFLFDLNIFKIVLLAQIDRFPQRIIPELSADCRAIFTLI